MKKKILSIVILSLTLALILSVGVLAAAESEVKLEIEGANLSFEDSVYVLYAISYENVAAEDIRMLFWTEAKPSLSDYKIGTESYSKAPEDEAATVGSKTCAVFKNDELRAKNMTDYVYARAYANVGGVEYYSEVSKYSILQYAYNMLGYTATASESAALKNMLSSMLEYGANAQIYFGYETDRLANADYYQINVVGGALEDGFTKGLYTSGEKATISAPLTSEGLDFKGWNDASGRTVSVNNPLVIDEFDSNESYTAIYGASGPEITDPM